jgi:hypothetical protein
MATKRWKNAPKYTVNVSLKAWDVARADAAITVKVRDRNGLLGTIQIGQGTFGWKRVGAQKFRRIPWSQIASALDES